MFLEEGVLELLLLVVDVQHLELVLVLLDGLLVTVELTRHRLYLLFHRLADHVTLTRVLVHALHLPFHLFQSLLQLADLGTVTALLFFRTLLFLIRFYLLQTCLPVPLQNLVHPVHLVPCLVQETVQFVVVERDALEVTLQFVGVNVVAHDDSAVELVVHHLFVLVVVQFTDLIPHALEVLGVDLFQVLSLLPQEVDLL